MLVIIVNADEWPTTLPLEAMVPARGRHKNLQ
jgi:hypothetical protein